MARRPRVFAAGLLYHVIVRGNHRQKTFLSEADYQAYLERLACYRKQYAYGVYAYCLMPNHVHLLLESSHQPLGKFMQGVQQSYSQYFNRRHRQVGHVFQGRYQAIICAKDEYLLALVRYIHLNPVRAGLVTKPELYRYSGHQDYLSAKPSAVLDPGRALALFGGRGGYKRFIADGMGEGHREEYYEVQDQRFLGAEGFGEDLQRRLGEPPGPVSPKPLDTLVKKLAHELAMPVAVLRSPDRSWAVSKARTVTAYVLVRRVGCRLGEVAAYLRRDIATVGTLVGRLYEQLPADPQLLRQIERLTKIAER
jgi:putative transposase